MKVEVKNGEIVCTAEDWKNLSKKESDFLSACYWKAIWTGFNENGELTFASDGNAYDKERKIAAMLSYAENRGIEVSLQVQEYRETLLGEAEKIKERQALEQEVRFKKERWVDRKKNGCAYCGFCEKKGDGDFLCKYSGDYLDFRFSEVYNPVTKAMEIFHEVGEPNEHCKDYILETVRNEKGERTYVKI